MSRAKPRDANPDTPIDEEVEAYDDVVGDVEIEANTSEVQIAEEIAGNIFDRALAVVRDLLQREIDEETEILPVYSGVDPVIRGQLDEVIGAALAYMGHYFRDRTPGGRHIERDQDIA